MISDCFYMSCSRYTPSFMVWEVGRCCW